MDIILHKPSQLINGTIQLPGSKSISNRVLMICALSGIDLNITNLSDSDDTNNLVKALTLIKNTTTSIIDIGHAGTDMRFLTAFLAMRPGVYELTGTERMQHRPVKELVDVLNQLGADISYKCKDGFPPLLISGKKINGGAATIKGNVSSQFISALLLSAPYFENGLTLTIENGIVSRAYIEMTIELMKQFGAKVLWEKQVITVQPVPYSYSEKEYTVESDWSAASYMYSLVALSTKNVNITLPKLLKTSLQPDAVCAILYQSFGVETNYGDNRIIISKTGAASFSKFEYDFINCPDLAQTIACTCVGLKTKFYLSGLQTLKVKETDRLIALKNELSACGIIADITKDSITCGEQVSLFIEEPVIKTYNDHRMAMSFAPLCFVFKNLKIKDAEVISKSYPNFWIDLHQLGITQTII